MRSSGYRTCLSSSKGCAKRGAFFGGQTIQLKSATDYSNDGYEQEADEISQKITSMGGSAFFKGAGSIRTKKIGSSVENFNGASQDIITGGGRPLDATARNFMEPKFGYDFSNVKIHNDTAAHQSASNINALAYTHGNNIVFGAGQYQPDTQAGKQLLAHELTHVVQQNGQAAAIQRKPRNEQADKAAEMFDNDVDDFKRNYHLKIVFKGFDTSQKAPVVAVKDGEIIGVTLGKAYVDEPEESARKVMLKAEIIGKLIKNDRFEDLANDPTHAKINEMNPPYRAGQYCTLNCPATAASLSEYLKTGNITKAYCNPVLEGDGKGYGFDISMNIFSKEMSWKQAETTIRKQLTKHGDFVVVEAKRSAEQMKKLNISALHYFTVVNVKGALFAIDAFGGGLVNSDLQNFIDNNIVANTYRLAKGEFKVKLVIL
jgi:hypothetical protein